MEIRKSKLADIGDVKMCKRVLKKQTSTNGDIPFYKISTFGNKPDAFISNELYEEYKSKYSHPKKGDILISAAGTVGKTVIYDGEPAYFQDSNIVWIDNNEEKVLNSYLYYFYQTEPWLTTRGSTIKRIYNNNLRNLVISYPDIETQSLLVSTLIKIDKKIELNNRINAELEAIAEIIYDYWFVQFDFPDENGRPYKSSGGEMVWSGELEMKIPENWNIDTLDKNFLVNPTEKLSKGQEYSYVDMNALPEDGYITKPVQTKEFKGGMKFRKNDVLVARITPCLENGKTALVTLLKKDEVAFGSTEFIVLRGLSKINYAYGACLARSKEFRHYAMLRMTGTSGRKRVKPDAIGRYQLATPPVELLEQFEKIVGIYFSIMTINARENEGLVKLRDCLLPMLMNGQITIESS